MASKLILIFILVAQLSIAQKVEKIVVGAGPEDILLDTLGNAERLIISCDERRDKKKTVEGDIWFLDIKSNKKEVFKRINEPDNFEFNPHGISLLADDKNKYLFVVNHYDNYKKSEVVRYTINNNTLTFDKRFPYKSSVNSVLALTKNHFLITNDVLFRGKVEEYKNEAFSIIDKNIKFPNGINKIDSVIYVSTTVSSEVYGYKITPNGSYQKLGSIAKIKGADNLRICKGKLITTSHPKLRKFLKHMKDSAKYSPTEVWEIDPVSKQTKLMFKDDGGQISAASTGLIYKNTLYISQVFEDFLLKIAY